MSETILLDDKVEENAIDPTAGSQDKSIRFELIPTYRTSTVSTPMLIEPFRLGESAASSEMKTLY